MRRLEAIATISLFALTSAALEHPMLDRPPANGNRSTIVWIGLLAVVLIIGGVQAALVWRACLPETDRLNRVRTYFRYLSGAICGGELIVLMDTIPMDRDIDWSNETFSVDEIRCNLRSGEVSVVPALLGVRHVVSDGTRLWRLPDYAGLRHPFVWRGRPVGLNDSHRGHPLLECFEGKWKESDEYLLAPWGYSVVPATSPQAESNSLPLLKFIRNQRNVFYHEGISTGTSEQAIDLQRQTSRNDKGQPAAGWKETDFDPADFPVLHRPSNLASCVIGIWIETSKVCAVKASYDLNSTVNFEFHWSSAKEHTTSQQIRSPIPWGRIGASSVNSISNAGWINTLTTSSGEVYFVSFDGQDGRIHVLNWKNGQLRLVAQRRSPLVWNLCQQVMGVACYSILIPTIVLGLFAWMIQMTEPRRTVVYGITTLTVASVFRRGIARSIDLSILLFILLASVVLHPDVTGWWFALKEKWAKVVSVSDIASAPSSVTFRRFFVDLGCFYGELISIPSIAWLFIAGILIMAVQIVWQAQTGQTLGKWICGVRVLRSTLRPCGLARSLLREILLVVDGVLMLCWVPGVISIVVTRQWQRIGDLLADTVVVELSLQ